MNYISVDNDKYCCKGEHSNMAIVVDGIIGAGKSTVAGLISEEFDVPLFNELKNEGTDNLAQRMLDKFYADQDRWSAIIQVMFLNERFKDIKEVEEKEDSAIFDRSIYGDEIFAKTILDRGQMTEDEFAIYSDLLHNMLEHIKVPEVLIYLDVSVDTAMERINKRARSTESDLIPRDYIEDLRRNYEEWYDNFNLCPKIKIDLNENCVNEKGEIVEPLKSKIINQIKPHLNR